MAGELTKPEQSKHEQSKLSLGFLTLPKLTKFKQSSSWRVVLAWRLFVPHHSY
jgi:hypothetical protein